MNLSEVSIGQALESKELMESKLFKSKEWKSCNTNILGHHDNLDLFIFSFHLDECDLFQLDLVVEPDIIE